MPFLLATARSGNTLAYFPCYMATVHRLSPPVREDEGVVARLIYTLAIAVVTVIVAAVALIASLVTLVAAAVAPFFNARWEPLLIAGGGVALLSLASLAWSVWRLTHVSWPTETVKSFEENWQ